MIACYTMHVQYTTIPCRVKVLEVQAVYEKPPRYRSYLLILWEERGREPSSAGEWRFRLEDPHTGKRMGFRSMDELFGYLQQQTGTAAGTGEGQEGG